MSAREIREQRQRRRLRALCPESAGGSETPTGAAQGARSPGAGFPKRYAKGGAAMPTTVLVTGGAGFIGSNTCKALAARGLSPG